MASRKPVPMKDWGKDHWSTFAYIETRVVDHSGVVHNAHLRCSPQRHPGHAHAGSRGRTPPTRLADGKEKRYHDDWDCIEDMVEAGLVVWGGTGLHPVFSLTALGWAMASALRQHKGSGGAYCFFAPLPKAARPVPVKEAK